jgi:hypothetical protein
MATKKVKKFGRGGDILTALGAGLAGYGAYKYFTKDKDKDKGDDYASRVKEYNAKNKSAEEPVSTDKKEPSAGEKRAMAASKGRPELIPEDADEATMRSDNYPSRKSVVKTTPKKAAPTDKKAALTDKKAPAASESSNTTPLTYYTPKAKKAEPAAKPYPQAEATARLKKAEAERRAGQGLTPRAEYTGIGSRKHIEGLRLERSQRLEEEAKKQFEKNKRENEANRGMKRGGKVKKYASGGSVKTAKPTMRSASSRADGIAIRGKTRA